jgi:LacI family transcriptional regulator
MRSIAREVGVSPSVVSQLLRGDPELRISGRRREEIFAARDRMGGIKVRRSKLSHVIVAPRGVSLSQKYVDRNVREQPLYRHFEQALETRGYRVQYEYIPEAVICDRIKEWIRLPVHPDGMLILSSYCTPELAALLRMYAFAHVSSDFTREHLEINTVCQHATGGMRQLVEHLSGLGHRRLAFMGPKPFHRHAMMVGAMTTLDLPVDPAANCWLGAIEYPEGQADIRARAAAAFDGWFRRRGEVTALVCSNDYVALGVVDAMRQRGLAPGRDLSIVGYDNIEARHLGSGERPILTTIDSPVEKIGRRMADLLLNQIEHGQTQIVHERLPVKLVARESTGRAGKVKS